MSTFNWESRGSAPVLNLPSNIWYSPGFFILILAPPLYISFLKKKRILSAVVTLIIMLVSLLILLIPHSVFKLILF